MKPEQQPSSSGAPPGCDLVFVLPHLGDGGMQRVATTMAAALAERGWRVQVITLFNRPDAYALDARVSRTHVPAIPTLAQTLRRALQRQREGLVRAAAAAGLTPYIRRLRARLPARRRLGVEKTGGGSSLWAARWALRGCGLHALRCALRGLAPRAVMAFGGSAGVLAIVAARGLGCRVVACERNDPARQTLKFPWQQLRPVVFPQADLVTANSQGALAALARFVEPKKLAFLPNPLALSAADENPPPEAREPVVLAVGRLHRQKGYDLLLRAFAEGLGSAPEWRLVVLGRGEQEAELRALAGELGLEARTEWLGQVADPGSHYRRASIFALPSRYEGMPNALLEAMASGLAVLVSNASPGLLELVRDGETGLVTPVEDGAALAAGLRRLAADPGLRRRLGSAARARAADFTLPRVVPVWERVAGLRDDKPC